MAKAGMKVKPVAKHEVEYPVKKYRDKYLAKSILEEQLADKKTAAKNRTLRGKKELAKESSPVTRAKKIQKDIDEGGDNIFLGDTQLESILTDRAEAVGKSSPTTRARARAKKVVEGMDWEKEDKKARAAKSAKPKKCK